MGPPKPYPDPSTPLSPLILFSSNAPGTPAVLTGQPEHSPGKAAPVLSAQS